MTPPVTPTMPALAASPSPIAAAATTASNGDAGQDERGFLRVLAEQRQNAEATSPAPAETDAASVARIEISDGPAPGTANDTTDQRVSTPRAAKSAKQPNAARCEPGKRKDDDGDDAALTTGLAAVTLDIAAQVAELQARRYPSSPTTTPVRAQTQAISPTTLGQRADTLAVGSGLRGDITLAAAEATEATEPTELGRAGALSATAQRFGLASPLGLRWSAQGSGNRPTVRAGVGAAAQSSAQLLAQLSASVAARAAGVAQRDSTLSATALARGTNQAESLTPPHSGDVEGAAFGDLFAHDLHGVSSDASAATASLVLSDATRANSEALRVAAPTLPAIAAPHWGQALGQRLVTLARQEGERHHAELRLDPPELGPLRVTLSITDGVANAAFVSPHAQVRHSVEAALEQLQATLAQAGIALGQTHVGEHDAPEHDAFRAQHPPGHYASVRVEPARETSAPVVHSDALVDVYA